MRNYPDQTKKMKFQIERASTSITHTMDIMNIYDVSYES